MYPRKKLLGALLLSTLTSGCALYDGFSDQAQWNTLDKTPDSSNPDMRAQADMTPDNDMPDQQPNVDMRDMGDLGLPPHDMAKDMADLPDMTEPSGPGTVKQISTGVNFTCALYNEGYVKCWGDNSNGQLGYEPLINTDRFTPGTRVGDIKDAVQISSGRRHTCVTTKRDEVFCWGLNDAGQLGELPKKDPNNPNKWLVPPSSSTPLKVIFPKDPSTNQDQRIVQVSSGHSTGETSMVFSDHTCALNDKGLVFCWGANSFGQRGASAPNPNATPMLADLTGITALSAGQLFNCALREDSRVMCWGYNYHGELGRPTMTPSVDRAAPNPSPDFVIDITKANRVWAGRRYACANLTPDQGSNDLACWGWFPSRPDFMDAQLFNVVPITNIGETIDLATGDDHICALRPDGQVHCWGASAYVGRGLAPSAPSIPHELVLIKDIIQISSKSVHTCALNNQSQVYCWGDNDKGQLGDGTVGNRFLPTQVVGLTTP